MLVEINGNKLSNNVLIYIYYKKITGRDLNADLSKLSFKGNKLKNIDLDLSKKKSEKELNEISESLNDTISFEFYINLYVAGRSAFENKELSYNDIAEELNYNDLYDEKILNSIVSLILPKNTDIKKK